MRGKAHGNTCRAFHLGITPACAGKRLTELFGPAGIGDHPRVCGEKRLRSLPVGLILGSPPRMRGKVVPCCVCWCWFRITPAYAGKSLLQFCFRLRWRDHPRVCGEKFFGPSPVFLALGSPPRMRGKAKQNCVGTLERRITPAYAGKSGINCRVKSSRKDHPRVCGEKREELGGILGPKGSPPRMRGKGKEPIKWLNLRRITPAYAGKRLFAMQMQQQEWDHPRVCGEKCWPKWQRLTEPGSPPRMRGKVTLYLIRQLSARITPAYAGKRDSIVTRRF